MKTRLLTAVLAVFGLFAVTVAAGETFTQRVRKFEHARKIDRANIQAMIEPAGSFSVTYWGNGTAGQCSINPNWDITVTQREDLDGTYINEGCTHEGPVPCFCDIYVPDTATVLNFRMALMRYQPGADAPVPLTIQ